MIFAKPWLDAIIVLLVVLLFFGPKRLPALGKSLGDGMREFKDSITGGSDSDEDSDKAGLNQATAAPTAPASTPPPQAAAPENPPPSAEQTSASPAAVAPAPASPAPTGQPAAPASPVPESTPVASSERRS
jgi:sec-independent protein translocase protein TatA